MKKKTFAALLIVFCVMMAFCVNAETAIPEATAAPSGVTPVAPGFSDEPLSTVLPETPTPVPTPVPTPTPTPEPTMAIIPTKEPQITDTPLPTEAPNPTSIAKFTPAPGSNNKSDAKKSENSGEIIFWAIASLVVGIWIGIGIGAAIWRKKSVFMTDKERKIIGRM